MEDRFKIILYIIENGETKEIIHTYKILTNAINEFHRIQLLTISDLAHRMYLIQNNNFEWSIKLIDTHNAKTLYRMKGIVNQSYKKLY
jgi:hypothetical protein